MNPQQPSARCATISARQLEGTGSKKHAEPSIVAYVLTEAFIHQWAKEQADDNKDIT